MADRAAGVRRFWGAWIMHEIENISGNSRWELGEGREKPTSKSLSVCRRHFRPQITQFPGFIEFLLNFWLLLANNPSKRSKSFGFPNFFPVENFLQETGWSFPPKIGFQIERKTNFAQQNRFWGNFFTNKFVQVGCGSRENFVYLTK